MSEPAIPAWSTSITTLRWRVAVFLLCCIGAGAAAGIIWAVSAFRPGYEVSEDLKASLGERGLAGIFAADAFFSVLLAAVGFLIGVACWLAFRRNGGWVSLLTVLGAGIASVVAWRVGLFVKPPDFSERLAIAVGGDMVLIDLQLHATIALLVAPFAGIAPVMLFAAFWPDPDDVPLVPERDKAEPAAE